MSEDGKTCKDVQQAKETDKQKAWEIVMVYFAHLGGRTINGK